MISQLPSVSSNTPAHKKLSIEIPSICIPRVMCFITEDKIRKVFEDLLGPPVTANPEIRSCVDRVDMIIREDVRTREPYFLVFVHFHPIEHTQEAQYLSSQINKNQEVVVVYDNPWFWKLRKNEGTRRQAIVPNAPKMIIPEEEMNKVRNMTSSATTPNTANA